MARRRRGCPQVGGCDCFPINSRRSQHRELTCVLGVHRGRRASAEGPTTAAALPRTVEVPDALDGIGLDEQAGRGQEEAMAVITIEGLTKRFGEVVAVDDLSFAVDQGTVVGFLGPNGAGGKTTTLRTLLGLVTPTAARPGSTVGPTGAGRSGPPCRRGAGGLQLPSRPRRPQPSPGRRHRRRSAPATAPTRSWPRSAWPRRPTGGSVASRSACANAWAWPPPCSATPRC